jgi:hypothetical protein
VYHPAIASDGSDIRYILTRAEEGLFAIRTETLPPPVHEWVRHIGDKEAAISVLDLGGGQWQNRAVFGRPAIFDYQGLQVGVTDIAGIPYHGFDGSHEGPRISALTMTPKLFLMADDFVTWQVRVQRLPGNIYNDTSTVRLDMYDVVSQQIIESSVQILLPPDKLDSTFVLTVALPPSHYPGDTITVSVDISGDAYDSGPRYYTVTQNIFCVEESLEKAPYREVIRTETAPRQPNLRLYPQPASGTLHLSMQAPASTQAVISIHDLFGRCLRRLTTSVPGDGALRLSVDVSDLRSGVYECRVITEESTTRRMVNIVR